MIHYKSYYGRIEYDQDAKLFHGEIINTRDVVTFQGRTTDELEQALRDSLSGFLPAAW